MVAKFANKKIGVVLGFYNGNEFIDDQIKSILDQSFKNIDIFIFDDNSSVDFKSRKIK